MSYPIYNFNGVQQTLIDPNHNFEIISDYSQPNYIPVNLPITNKAIHEWHITANPYAVPYFIYDGNNSITVENGNILIPYVHDQNPYTQIQSPYIQVQAQYEESQLGCTYLQSNANLLNTVRVYDIESTDSFIKPSLNPEAVAFIPKKTITKKTDLSTTYQLNQQMEKLPEIELEFDNMSLVPSQEKDDAKFDDFTKKLYRINDRGSQKVRKRINKNKAQLNRKLFFEFTNSKNTEIKKIIKSITFGIEETQEYKDLEDVKTSNEEMKEARKFFLSPEQLLFQAIEAFLPYRNSQPVKLSNIFLPDFRIIHANTSFIDFLDNKRINTLTSHIDKEDKKFIFDLSHSTEIIMFSNIINEAIIKNYQCFDPENPSREINDSILYKSKLMSHLAFHLALDQKFMDIPEAVLSVFSCILTPLKLASCLKIELESTYQEMIMCLVTLLNQSHIHKALLPVIQREIHNCSREKNNQVRYKNNLVKLETETLIESLPELIIGGLDHYYSKKNSSDYYFSLYDCASKLPIFHHSLLNPKKNYQQKIIRHTSAIINYIDKQLDLCTTFFDRNATHYLLQNLDQFWIPRINNVLKNVASEHSKKDITDLNNRVDILKEKIDRIEAKEKLADEKLKKEIENMAAEITKPKRTNRLYLVFKEKQRIEPRKEELKSQAEGTFTPKNKAKKQSSLIVDVNNTLKSLDTKHPFADIRNWVEKRLANHLKADSHKLWVYSEVASKILHECLNTITSTVKAIDIAENIHLQLQASLDERKKIDKPRESKKFLDDRFPNSEIKVKNLSKIKERMNSINKINLQIDSIISFIGLAIGSGEKVIENIDSHSKINGEISLDELIEHFEHTKFILEGLLQKYLITIKKGVSMCEIMKSRKELLKELKLYGVSSFNSSIKKEKDIERSQSKMLEKLQERDSDKEHIDQKLLENLLPKVNTLYNSFNFYLNKGKATSD